MYEIDWSKVIFVSIPSTLVACAISFEWYGLAAGITFFFWLAKT